MCSINIWENSNVLSPHVYIYMCVYQKKDRSRINNYKGIMSHVKIIVLVTSKNAMSTISNIFTIYYIGLIFVNN